MRNLLLIWIVFSSFLFATSEKVEVFTKYKQSNNTVLFKWIPRVYASDYTYKLYKDNKLISTVTALPYTVMSSKYTKDEMELAYPYKSATKIEDIISLAKNIDKVNGFRALYILQKNSFSKDIGQYYEDKNIQKGQTYLYKLETIKENKIYATNEIKIDTNNDYKDLIIWTQAKSYDWGVGLSWDVSSDFGMYNIYKKNNNGKFLQANQEPFFINSDFIKIMYKDKDLKQGEEASYYIRKIDEFEDEGIASQIVTQKRKEKKLSIVQDIKIKTTDNAISLSWQKNKDAISYDVYRSIDYSGVFKKLNKKDILNSQFIDTRFKSKINYYYYVIAKNGKRVSSPSVKMLAYARDVTPPKAPKNLTFKTKAGIVSLKWNIVTDNDLLGYRVYMSMKKDNKEWTRLDVNNTKVNAFIHKRDKKLSRYYYYYKVVAIDGSFNESKFSNIVKVKLPDVTAPLSPKIIEYKVTLQGLSLKWKNVNDWDKLIYNVYRQYEGEVKKINKYNIKEKNIFIDKYPLQNKAVQYFVRAIDPSGNISKIENKVNVIYKSKRLPEAKLILKSMKKGVEIILQTKQNDIVGFDIYRSENSKDFYKVKYIKGKSYLDVEAIYKGKKYYKIIIYNKAGKSKVLISSIDK